MGDYGRRAILLGHVVDDCGCCEAEDVKLYPVGSETPEFDRRPEFDGEWFVCFDCYKENTPERFDHSE